MPLNQLIAQGGTQIKSPVQRYMEAQDQMKREQMNRLAMESTRQQMAAFPAQQELARRAKEEQILTSQAARQRPAKSPYAAIDPADYTPESLRAFEQSRSVADLRAKQKGTAEDLSIGEEAVDRAFAKDYVEWTTGGFADVEKNLMQLKNATTRLESGKENLTGPVIGRMPDIVKQQTHPEAIDVRDQVEEVVQRNLRLILGAQFTQREGERLIARAYNENLDEATNAKRLKRLVTAIEKAAKAKQSTVDYYNKHGTLKGYTGKQFSLYDINTALEAEDVKLTTPKTDEEYEALPSGAEYIDPDDGKRYRKP